MPSIDRRSLASLLALALFTFVFLGGEFFFDRQIGQLVSAEEVVGAQALVLGTSVVGFLAFASIEKLPKSRAWAPAIEAAGTIACLCAIFSSTDPAIVQIAGCLGFFLLGCLGSAAHWSMASAFENSPSLAKGAGSAYAAGILLQFANNQFAPAGAGELAVLCIGTVALAAPMLAAQKDRPRETQPTGHHGESASTLPCNRVISDAQTTVTSNTRKRIFLTCPKTAGIIAHTPNRENGNPQPLSRALWSVALVAILACMFSTLDNVVTIADAQGAVSVDEWPRLFLAASGLVAGVLFDIRERRYMGFIMFSITVLSIISILAVEAGASPVIGLIVFYLSSGFFVTFFTATFLQLAPRMCTPQLWAGMGRAANNLCAFTISGASLALTQAGVVSVMIASLVLFVLATVAFMGAGLFRLPQTTREREVIEAGKAAENAPSPEELQAAFIEAHSLTPREADVLRAVTADERPLKNIADDLGISLRMVQRHLTNIYEKTGTQTRAGLAKKFLGK